MASRRKALIGTIAGLVVVAAMIAPPAMARKGDTLWRGDVDLAAAGSGWQGDGTGTYRHPEALVSLTDGSQTDALSWSVATAGLTPGRTTMLDVQAEGPSPLPGILPGEPTTVLSATCASTTFRFDNAENPQWFSANTGPTSGSARIVCMETKSSGWFVAYPDGSNNGRRCVTVIEGAPTAGGHRRFGFSPAPDCVASVHRIERNRVVGDAQRHLVPFALDLVVTYST